MTTPDAPSEREAARRHPAGNIGDVHADRILARIHDLPADPATMPDAAHLAHRMAGSVALLGLGAPRDVLIDLNDGLPRGTQAQPDILTRMRAIAMLSP